MVVRYRSSLDTFTDAYIAAALWSSTDDSGESMDDSYGRESIAEETLAQMVADCANFYKNNLNDVLMDPQQAGHDFWLTRNGHGAGFWDGHWPKDAEKRLMRSSKKYKEFDLYVGDDNKIHGM